MNIWAGLKAAGAMAGFIGCGALVVMLAAYFPGVAFTLFLIGCMVWAFNEGAKNG